MTLICGCPFLASVVTVTTILMPVLSAMRMSQGLHMSMKNGSMLQRKIDIGSRSLHRLWPPKRGTGCFGKSCLTLVVLAILLVVVGVGGSFWTVRHVYLSDKPAPIPEAAAATKTTAAAAGETNVAAAERKKC